MQTSPSAPPTLLDLVVAVLEVTQSRVEAAAVINDLLNSGRVNFSDPSARRKCARVQRAL